MPSKRLVLFSLLIFGLVSVALMQTTVQSEEEGLIAGQNMNVVGGTDPFTGDPYLQRQNEPTLAFSTRNVMNILVGMNDYRTIDIPFEDVLPGAVINQPAPDAWLSYAQSNDGGVSWKSFLLPGYPQDPDGELSPLWGYGTAADPVVRAATNGLFLMAGVAFNRDLKNGNPVFVSRFIDNNNKEFESAIDFVDTTIWNTADSDVFFDKPWLEVDGPHGVGQKVTIAGQSIPKSNVYLAYAAFQGVEVATKGYTGIQQVDLTSQIYFQRSTDCGQTFEPPVIFDSGHAINQGVSIAVDPRNNGQLVCTWRTFGGPYEAIMAAISTNNGLDWDRVVEVAAFPPDPNGAFDQPTTDFTFRTNSYPAAAIDQNGYLYIVWTQRGLGPNGEARLLISSSSTGLAWSPPMRVDSLQDQQQSGNQFQPSITIAAGKMLIAWVDQRFDVVQHIVPGMFGDPFIQEFYYPPVRHTLDIRVAQAEPSLTPIFSKSIQVSRYLWAYMGGQATQLEYHKPNLRIFSQGTKPFISDYIDIAPSPRFLPKGNSWVFNKDPNPATTFQVAWTDNRDVWGDFAAIYNPPGSGCGDGDATGIRNQNVYTSRISEGIIAGSPGNTKPLNIKRAFVVQARNTTALEKNIRFEIDTSTAPYARFWEAGIEYDYLDRAIPPYSAFATTVLVDPYGDEYAPVYVNILENGTIVSQVMLNPDPTNPEIQDPYSDDPYSNPHIVNDEVHTPHIVNWTYEEVNPHIVNYDPANPHIVNTDMVTPHIVNEDLENPHIVNETVNPHIVNPHIVNVAPGSTGTDTIYTVENLGNTTSSYSMGTYPADVPEGLLVQILVYKIYTTPTSQGCELNNSEHHELLINHTNPHIVNTSQAATTQGIDNMLQENEDVWDAHFYLQPGEQAYIVYRTYNPDPLNIHFDDPLVPKLTSDIANVWDGNLGQLPAFPLLVVTTAVEAGIAGEPFSADIQAFGGTGPYIWQLLGAPAGMSIDSATGIISWPTPTEGPHSFIVRVTDQGDPQQVEEQSFTLNVVAKLEITTDILNDGVVDQSYPGTQMQAIGGTGIYTWSLDVAPGWMEIDPDTGLIGQNADPDEIGSFSVTVRATDPGPPYQTDTVDLSVDIGEPLQIITESLPNSIEGITYGASVEALGGIGEYEWWLEDPPGDMEIDLLTGIITWPTPLVGTHNFTVHVQDEFTPTPLTTSKAFSIVIYQILSIETESSDLDPANVGTAYSASLEAGGGLGPFTWGLTDDSGPLPDGLTLSTEGVISGEPAYDPGTTYPQDYIFEVYVQDFIQFQEATKELTITVNPKVPTGVIIPDETGDTEANSVAVDDFGNVFVVGKITPDGSEYSDLYIAKYFVNGDLHWKKTLDGGQGGNDEAEAIAVAMAGDSTGIYVTGYITGPNGDTDIFLIKFSGDGVEEWRKEIDGGNGDDQASAIAVKDGVVCITGFSTGKSSGADYQTYAFSTSGADKWDAIFDGPAHQGDFATAIAISDSGNVSITGSSYRGNKQRGHLDYHTITYDSLGEMIWEARYDGKENGDDEALAIAVDLADNVYITGRSELSKKKIKDFDYYTIKYDALGEVVWDVRYDSGLGHDEAKAMALDDTGLYVTGYDTGELSGANYYTVKYDLTDGHVLGEAWYDAENGEDKASGLALDSTGVHVTGWSKPGNGTDFDIYTVKYTTSLADILWETRYDGENGSDDFAVAIVKSITGDVYVTGISQTGISTSMVTLKY